MIRHIVAWNLKDEFTPEEKAEHSAGIKKELESLVGVVPGLVGVKVFTKVEESSDRQIILDTFLTSAEALKVYKDHPAHKKAGEYIRSVVKDRVALDFEI
ncbi:MAG: Dabb family protein [Lachnospiraceae bacterium]|nr:Dabb family protein [Lachnospiraceae bacterium]